MRSYRQGTATRGFFSETWIRGAFAEAGIKLDLVQDNYSLSAEAGTLRGLHFQTPPRAQAKLVRVPQGAIFDVVVDIRNGSPNFGGRCEGTEISREKWTRSWCRRSTQCLHQVGTQYRSDQQGGQTSIRQCTTAPFTSMTRLSASRGRPSCSLSFVGQGQSSSILVRGRDRLRCAERAAV